MVEVCREAEIGVMTGRPLTETDRPPPVGRAMDLLLMLEVFHLLYLSSTLRGRRPAPATANKKGAHDEQTSGRP